MRHSRGFDPRKRFTKVAGLYDRYRPGYPKELVDWIAATAGLTPGSRIADVGCGTGISTRLFAGRGYDAVGIEPNVAMLSKARRLGGAGYRRGDSTATGLPDASVDLVIAAQAFHWFDIRPTLREFRRILKPRGWCAAFWNIRERRGFMGRLDRLLLKHSAGYSKIAGTERRVLSDIRRSGLTRGWRRAVFANSQRLTRAELVGRMRSASYVAHAVARQYEFERELHELFEPWQKDRRVTLLYRTPAAAWRMRVVPDPKKPRRRRAPRLVPWDPTTGLADRRPGRA